MRTPCFLKYLQYCLFELVTIKCFKLLYNLLNISFIIIGIIYFIKFAAAGGIEPQACALPVQRLPIGFKYAPLPHGNVHLIHEGAPGECQVECLVSSSQMRSHP